MKHNIYLLSFIYILSFIFEIQALSADKNLPYFGITINAVDGSLDGLPVVDVFINSPADISGILPGELIIAVNGLKILKTQDWYTVVNSNWETNQIAKPLKLLVKSVDGAERTVDSFMFLYAGESATFMSAILNKLKRRTEYKKAIGN